MSEQEPAPPHGRRPLPASADWRRAFDVYVVGRSRALTADEKRGIARARARHRASPPERGATRSLEASYGVPIPERLQYHRNASTWRNHLPEPESPGRTTSGD